jgi:hypothetical protein
MSITKPSLPKGTRDFSPQEMVKRNYIFDTIKTVFKKYGYAEIQTPSMENLQTLTGKYGDEGDKLIFKILNSGKLNHKDAKRIAEEDYSFRLSSDGVNHEISVLNSSGIENPIDFLLQQIGESKIQILKKHYVTI